MAERANGAEFPEIHLKLSKLNQTDCFPSLSEQEVKTIAKGVVDRYPSGEGNPPSALQIAQQILQCNRIKTDCYGNSYLYNGYCWEPVTDRKLERLTRKHDNPKCVKKHRCKDIAYFIKIESSRGSNFCKHMIVSNHLPSLQDTSGAIFNRLLIIQFSNQIPVEKRDPEIREKLKKEIPGIMLRALQGLERLINNNGQFTVPPSSYDLLEQYRDDSNPLSEFLLTCLEPSEGHKIHMNDIRKVIRDFLPNNRDTNTGITQMLNALGCEIKTTSVNSRKGKYLIGYKFTNDDGPRNIKRFSPSFVTDN